MAEEQLKGYYDLTKMSDTDPGITVPIRLTLPEDEGRLLQLAAKLVEYQEREHNNQYKSPHFFRPIERYKELVLGQLLVEGSISVGELSVQTAAKEGEQFDEGEFEEATRVILDYLELGKAPNGTGTGLTPAESLI